MHSSPANIFINNSNTLFFRLPMRFVSNRLRVWNRSVRASSRGRRSVKKKSAVKKPLQVIEIVETLREFARYETHRKRGESTRVLSIARRESGKERETRNRRSVFLKREGIDGACHAFSKIGFGLVLELLRRRVARLLCSQGEIGENNLKVAKCQSKSEKSEIFPSLKDKWNARDFVEGREREIDPRDHITLPVHLSSAYERRGNRKKSKRRRKKRRKLWEERNDERVFRKYSICVCCSHIYIYFSRRVSANSTSWNTVPSIYIYYFRAIDLSMISCIRPRSGRNLVVRWKEKKKKREEKKRKKERDTVNAWITRQHFFLSRVKRCYSFLRNIRQRTLVFHYHCYIFLFNSVYYVSSKTEKSLTKYFSIHFILQLIFSFSLSLSLFFF